MAKRVGFFLLSLLFFSILTILSQVGGMVIIFGVLLYKGGIHYKYIKPNAISKTSILLVVYLLASFLIIPFIAKLYGRVSLLSADNLSQHRLMTPLLNRHYVDPELKVALTEVAENA